MFGFQSLQIDRIEKLKKNIIFYYFIHRRD